MILRQIHLSTAVVLMFVAGGMIWQNVVPRQTRSTTHVSAKATLHTYIYGWPIFTISRWSLETSDPEIKVTGNSGAIAEQGSFVQMAVINGIPCLLILYLIAAILESMINSKQIRK
ncbi:MAG TPA: hypothetical protein VKX17_17300 [Planctomycetota bacterium]|nr:hypothetical protein [Planctomycetota bacterium]